MSWLSWVLILTKFPILVLTLLHTVLIWSSQVSVEFIIAPKNFVYTTRSIMTSSKARHQLLFINIFRLFLNKIFLVFFTSFKESLLSLNHFETFANSLLTFWLRSFKFLSLKMCRQLRYMKMLRHSSLHRLKYRCFRYCTMCCFYQRSIQ